VAGLDSVPVVELVAFVSTLAFMSAFAGVAGAGAAEGGLISMFLF